MDHSRWGRREPSGIEGCFIAYCRRWIASGLVLGATSGTANFKAVAYADSGAALPSDIVVRVAALAREALLADAGTFRVAAVVPEALVSDAEAPPPLDEAPRFWTTILA